MQRTITCNRNFNFDDVWPQVHSVTKESIQSQISNYCKRLTGMLSVCNPWAILSSKIQSQNPYCIWITYETWLPPAVKHVCSPWSTIKRPTVCSFFHYRPPTSYPVTRSPTMDLPRVGREWLHAGNYNLQHNIKSRLYRVNKTYYNSLNSYKINSTKDKMTD